MKQKCAGKTNYPQIYKDTYWGSFIYEDNTAGAGIKEVIDERNNFAEEFTIKKHVKAGAASTKANLDHLELYEDRDLRGILVYSPYGFGYDDGRRREIAASMGFTILPQMYHPAAYTFCRVFDSVPHARKWLKEKSERKS